MTFKPPYEFGPFRLDPAKRLLLRDGVPVPLTPKALDALLLLVESSGQLVPKDELMNALWADSHVDEANLTQTVFMLRKALGETASDQQHVLTVPGRGYRFAGDVKQVSSNGTSPANSSAIIPEAASVVPGKKPVFRRWPLAVAVAVSLTLALIAAVGWYRSRAQPVSGGRTMLAVLPFENLTGDVRQDYLSDGLTEEMIVQLERLDPGHLGVIASTSAMRYRDLHGLPQQVGERLGVQYLLQGSIRRDGDDIRVSAKLVQAQQQTYLWARQYDRKLTNLLALQSEIAHDIADEIRLTVGGGRRQTLPVPVPSATNFGAYDLYLKGRYFWNKRTPQALLQAIEYFEKATQSDTRYAPAYAGLADSYSLYSGYTLTPATESMPKARAAAVRAMELDPNLAEAHTSLAVIAQDYDWDWKTAEKEYRRAIQLDPNYATAHQWYAEYLGLQGRFTEAFSEMDRARRLDPLSLIIAADNAAILYYSRQYDQAIAQFRSVLEMQPNFPRARMLIYPYAEKGMFADALSDAEKWHGPDDSLGRWSDLAYLYGRSGQLGRARGALKSLEELYAHRQLDPAPILVAYIGTGDKDRAFSCLEQAYSQHSSNLTNLKVSPLYDPLRSDARFQALLRRIGLAP